MLPLTICSIPINTLRWIFFSLGFMSFKNKGKFVLKRSCGEVFVRRRLFNVYGLSLRCQCDVTIRGKAVAPTAILYLYN